MPQRSYIDEFFPLVADTSIRRAAILMGPMRVGKTVMIYHSIDKLIESGIPPQKIIYVSIDTPIYNNISLEELFNYAHTALKQEDNYEGFYVFFNRLPKFLHRFFVFFQFLST